MIVTDPALIGPWVCERGGGTWIAGRGQAIGLMRSGKLIAGVLYEDWNRAHVVCHIAGEGNWASSREYLRVIFDYPFRQLKVRRITVPVAESNRIARRFVERLGFVFEASLKDAHPEGDLIIYKMTPDQCRWLKD